MSTLAHENSYACEPDYPIEYKSGNATTYDYALLGVTEDPQPYDKPLDSILVGNFKRKVCSSNVARTHIKEPIIQDDSFRASFDLAKLLLEASIDRSDESASALQPGIDSDAMSSLDTLSSITTNNELDAARQIISDKLYDLIAVIGFRQAEQSERNLKISDTNNFRDSFAKEYCDILDISPLKSPGVLKLLFMEFVRYLKKGGVEQGWGTVEYCPTVGIMLKTQPAKVQFKLDEIEPAAEITWNEFPA